MTKANLKMLVSIASQTSGSIALDRMKPAGRTMAYRMLIELPEMVRRDGRNICITEAGREAVAAINT